MRIGRAGFCTPGRVREQRQRPAVFLDRQDSDPAAKLGTMLSPDPTSGSPQGRWFAATHWSVVLTAGRASHSGARDALDKLCQTYWPPLYAYILRQGHSPPDAQDLTQGFFAWLLESDHLRAADPEAGKFRSFLLVRLKHFLSDERKRAQALKRGGGKPILSWEADLVDGEGGEPAGSELTPDRVYDRRWAITLLERSVGRLRQEYALAGRVELFEALRQFPLADRGGLSYATTAASMGLTESAVKSAVHRLRQRHRQLLREEISQTVATPAEVDEELRYLISVIGQHP
jgi:RNA polymerase sigma factor (sigma-70 family)